MRKSLLLSCFLLSVVCVKAQKAKSGEDKRLVGLDTALNKLLAEWKVAGFAVAIVEKDKVIYSKGFGYRDFENKKPVTANTLFSIGSCTKAFTASLLGLLEKDGKISIDKPATQYLPGLHFFNEKMNNTITSRDMMSHRTGLPRHDYAWYLFPTFSYDTLVQRLQYLEPNAAIREKWQYNNFMYMLQGEVVQKVTGRSWEENVKQKIFGPLGMTRSDFSVVDLQKDEDASKGYTVKDDSIVKKIDYFNIAAMGPAGSINSSVNEMAQWVSTWIYAGKYKGKEILPSSYTRDAISSQMVIGPALPTHDVPDVYFSNYGLGWFLSSYRGHYRVEHGGNIDGFSASTCFFPSDSVGIIVLVNQNASAVPSIARNMIADRMLQLKYINWNGRQRNAVNKAKDEEKGVAKNKTSNRVTGTKPSHPLADYQGLYTHPGYGQIEIYLEKDSLLARTVKEKVWLRHYHYDVFEIKGYDPAEGPDTTAGGVLANFRTNDMGKIESMLMPLENSLKPIEFMNTPAPKSVSKDELEKYTGEYEMGGMIAKVYLKGNTLFLFVAGQPEYETIASGDHTFILKGVSGYSMKFEVKDDNTVTGVSFIQPNGTFKATKKK